MRIASVVLEYGGCDDNGLISIGVLPLKSIRLPRYTSLKETTLVYRIALYGEVTQSIAEWKVGYHRQSVWFPLGTLGRTVVISLLP